MENYAQPSVVPMPTATQPPVIEVASRDLEKMLAELTEITTVLEGRLAPVMREPEPSQVRADNPGITPAQSQIALVLRQRVAEAESIAYRLSSIIRRLEI